MGATTTVRITYETHSKIVALAEQTQEPIQGVIAKAIDAYLRARFFEEVNTAFAALRESPEAWKEETEERVAWDATAQDGVNDE